MPGAEWGVDFDGAGMASMVRQLAGKFLNPAEPAARSAVYLVGQTQRAFEREGLVEPWQELSMLTRFIRAHRASAPNKTALPMRDTGRLMGSFLPFSSPDGLEFGASTAVSYAELMQEGGMSAGGSVEIGPFRRRLPSRMTGGEWKGAQKRGGAAKRAARAFGTVLVKAYTMQLKPSQVPARPFYPRDAGDMETLGYMDGVQKVWADYFAGGLQ